LAKIKFKDIGISHLYGCVPKNRVKNRSYTKHFSSDTANAIVEKTGIEERRFAPPGVCASDLCYEAAKVLIEKEHINKHDISFLIFVSQTPDYRMPATAITLQDRLGLGKDTMAFDLSLGCSGFVYGLSTLFGLMQGSGTGKGLLLVGETRSRVYSPEDRRTAFLFGDAGIACLVDRDTKYGDVFFELFSDGSHQHLIKMDAGGYRNPSTPETLMMKVRDEEGNSRSDEHGYMDGGEVFNFVLEHIPKSIKSICNWAEIDLNELQYYAFHQANLFMNDYLVKKLKLNPSKVLSNVNRFGNTSSVSIPLALITELPDIKDAYKKYSLLSGFGVGMSWANALIDVNHVKIGELIEC
jgi:3-oxoacyl-[acyl-carrier-protein] synthase III